VTLTASWQKIFHEDPRIGFFAQRNAAQEALANGEPFTGTSSLAQTEQIITNATVDGILSILFAVAIIVVIADAARVWIGLIFGGKEPEMNEAPYEPSSIETPPGTVTAMSSNRDA
jgi:carbon starvation protein